MTGYEGCLILVYKGLIKRVCQVYNMADVEDSSHAQVSASTSVISSLQKSLEHWCINGFADFDDVMYDLYKSELITDPMVKVMVFNIMGGYINNFSRAFDMNKDVLESHQIAFATMIQDPTVSKFVQNFMSDMVTSNIEKVIN